MVARFGVRAISVALVAETALLCVLAVVLPHTSTATAPPLLIGVNTLSGLAVGLIDSQDRPEPGTDAAAQLGRLARRRGRIPAARVAPVRDGVHRRGHRHRAGRWHHAALPHGHRRRAALLGPTSWDTAGDPATLRQSTADTEAKAGLIRGYQPAILPGLFQTAAYARHVLSAGPDGPPPDLAERVLARLERQRILYDDTKRLEFVIPEAVLRSPLGPPAEHTEQLARLGEILRRPNVDLRILPLTAAPVWRTSGFVLFENLPGAEPFVHIELLTRPINIDEPTQVDTYRRAFLRLQQASTTGDQTEEMITQIRRGGAHR